MKKEFIPVLRFVSSSDAHIEGIDTVGYKRLKKAIEQKPYAHCFEEADKITEEKKMNQIGG